MGRHAIKNVRDGQPTARQLHLQIARFGHRVSHIWVTDSENAAGNREIVNVFNRLTPITQECQQAAAKP